MPKMRTHSGTKKRVKKTASGKLKVKHAFRVHLLSAKSKAAKRRHKNSKIVDKSDVKRIKQQIANVK